MPNSISTIPVSTFQNCSNLTSVILPESIKNIELNAFNGCAQLKTLNLPDNIVSIAMASGYKEFSCFAPQCKLYVNKGTTTLFALWSAKYTPYSKGSEEMLKAPVPSVVSSTYTTAKCKIDNFYEDYVYKYSTSSYYDNEYAKDVPSKEFTIDCLRPGGSCERYLRVIKNDAYYECKIQITTKPFTPTINVDLKSPTSIAATIKNKTNDEFELVNKQTAICSRTEVYKRDPKPDKTFYYQDKNEYWWYVYSIENETEILESDTLIFTGLNPAKTYYIVYQYEVNYDPYNYGSYKSSFLKEVATSDLTLVTEQPKVVSKGNVVVAATTNINESESNVGFEWRREDWGDSFVSKTGKAYIFNGTMEGYIQNLNTEKLWKCRAYYLSKSGTYYYGDWVGIDPTDFSFFEPTVHTYTNIIATGNTASVKGYALNGSDEIAQQGFVYWKVDAAEITRGYGGVNVPDNAQIVEAKGQVMSVTLSSLEYDSQYSVVAFVKTSNGNTFYGEERSFTTETAPTGIEVKDVNINDNDELNIVAYYDVNGVRISKLQKGLNIVRLKDGTTKKVLIK